MSNIVTSVNTNVPIKGNGMIAGFTNGSNNTSIFGGTGNNVYNSQGGYGKNLGISASGTALTDNKYFGITTDETKSGIIGTVTRVSITCEYIIKY